MKRLARRVLKRFQNVKRILDRRLFGAAGASLFRTLFLAGGFTATFAGCHRFLQSAPEAGSAKALQLTPVTCFGPAMDAAERYFKGQADAAETASAWDCGVHAVDLYLKNFKPTDEDGYSVEYVRRFFQRDIFGAVPISDELVQQTIKLKMAIVGGSADRISREELQRGREALLALKAESIKLLPYIGMLTLKDDPDLYHDRPEVVAGASRQLNLSAAALGALFSASEGAYALSDAQDFLTEVEKLYAPRSDWKGPQWLARKTRLISAVKAFFVRGPGDTVQPEEWGPLLGSAGQLYGIYIEKVYGITGRELLQGQGLIELTAAVESACDALAAAVKNKVDGIIRWDAIDNLITEIYAAKFVEKPPLAEATVKNLLQALLNRVFNPEYSEYGGRIPQGDGGLTAPIVKRMREEFKAWATVQGLWDQVEANAELSPDGRFRMSEVRVAWEAAANPDTTVKTDPIVQQHIDEMSRLFAQAHPLAFSKRDTVIFPEGGGELSIDRKSFTSLNWKRWIIHAAIQGFAADPLAARWTGLTKAEFHEFFDALYLTAVDIRMIAPGHLDVWKSTFGEGQVFLFQSQGLDKLSFDEGVDLIGFALSSSVLSRATFARLTAPGACEHFGMDEFALPTFPESCFRQKMRADFLTDYGAIPGWKQLVTDPQFGEAQWADLIDSFVKAVRHAGDPPDIMTSSHVDRMTAIVQYIESVFVRYDLKQNGTLDLADASLAFPVFRSLLRQEANGQVSDEDLYPLFTYILKYRQAPDSSASGAAAWLSWKWTGGTGLLNYPKWKIACDRRCLVKVLGDFAARDASSGAVAP